MLNVIFGNVSRLVQCQFLFREKLKRSSDRKTSSAHFVFNSLELQFLCLCFNLNFREYTNHKWMLVLKLTSKYLRFSTERIIMIHNPGSRSFKKLH